MHTTQEIPSCSEDIPLFSGTNYRESRINSKIEQVIQLMTNELKISEEDFRSLKDKVLKLAKLGMTIPEIASCAGMSQGELEMLTEPEALFKKIEEVDDLFQKKITRLVDERNENKGKIMVIQDNLFDIAMGVKTIRDAEKRKIKLNKNPMTCLNWLIKKQMNFDLNKTQGVIHSDCERETGIHVSAVGRSFDKLVEFGLLDQVEITGPIEMGDARNVYELSDRLKRELLN